MNEKLANLPVLIEIKSFYLWTVEYGSVGKVLAACEPKFQTLAPVVKNQA